MHTIDYIINNRALMKQSKISLVLKLLLPTKSTKHKNYNYKLMNTFYINKRRNFIESILQNIQTIIIESIIH